MPRFMTNTKKNDISMHVPFIIPSVLHTASMVADCDNETTDIDPSDNIPRACP